MTHEEDLRQSFRTLKASDDFSEAVLGMQDGSTLQFRHRVGERWVRAGGAASPASRADKILATIAGFRLNGKHLEIWFEDGSRWEARFR
jgi:hypothetical protein